MPTMREVIESEEYACGTVWRVNDPEALSRHGAIVMKVATTTRPVMTILESVPGGPRRGDSWSSCEIPVEPVTMEIERTNAASQIASTDWAQVRLEDFNQRFNRQMIELMDIRRPLIFTSSNPTLYRNRIWQIEPPAQRDGDERPEDTDALGPI